MAIQLGSKLSSLSSKATAVAVVALLGLSACASTVPVSDQYPMLDQPLVESAAHWQIIADDMWSEVKASLEAGGYHETSIGLESPAQQTQFTHALDNFLFTDIVSSGVAVTPDSQFTISYSVQILKYTPESGAIGSTSAPASNGWADSDSTTEMVLTVSVTDGSSVRIRRSKVFYIDDAETAIYEPTRPIDADAGNSPVVSSNWYSDNPHLVEPIAMHQANQFALMIDPVNGPIHSMDDATGVAAAHCGKVGKHQAKYISEGYPTNDRNQIRAVYECM